MKNNQGKVSMVSPCYNKVKYIGKMLDSLIVQEWDNIEVILVNDGSTDGTREVIAEYAPKLKQRGYEVVIVDQDNAGCCAAVYAGLIRMTGDYFCLLDCDDWLDPKYVSHMANWLDTHEDYDVAACNYRTYKNGILGGGMSDCYAYQISNENLLEKWILRQVIVVVWVYMPRVSYLKKCGLIENWNTDRNKTYEPLIAVPLMSGGGKFEYFNEPLYIYNQDDEGGLFLSINSEKTSASVQSFYDDYKTQLIYSINRLDVSDNRKEYLFKLVEVFYLHDVSQMLRYSVNESKKYLAELLEKSVGAINDLAGDKYIVPKNTEFNDCLVLCKYAAGRFIDGLGRCENRGTNDKFDILKKPVGNIIVVAALGKAAERYLSKLATTRFRPTEFWDHGGDGEIVKKPPKELPEFSGNDIVFCFSRKSEIMAYYRNLFTDSKAILFSADDTDILLSLLKFMPKEIA
jgi:glycosyltransferase involved in cell wall biosynthesis